MSAEIFMIDNRPVSEAEFNAASAANKEERATRLKLRVASAEQRIAADIRRSQRATMRSIEQAAKAAGIALHQRRLRLWARHKAELAELKARHAKELADLQ